MSKSFIKTVETKKKEFAKQNLLKFDEYKKGCVLLTIRRENGCGWTNPNRVDILNRETNKVDTKLVMKVWNKDFSASIFCLKYNNEITTISDDEKELSILINTQGKNTLGKPFMYKIWDKNNSIEKIVSGNEFIKSFDVY